MPAQAAVAYYRVSTQKQGQSGLGLEAQEAAVTSYAASQGLNIASSFTEVESGRKKDRPQLIEALAVCKRTGSTLLIAKLDRLARNVAFISALMESGVDFVAVDMPEADKLTLHVMAAVAEREAELISARTKAALAARKARGLPLGTNNLTPERRALGPQKQCQKARHELKQPCAFAQSLRRQEMALRDIAATLNEAGFTTRKGCRFTAMQVKRMLDRENT